jgi:hypothetical protein
MHHRLRSRLRWHWSPRDLDHQIKLGSEPPRTVGITQVASLLPAISMGAQRRSDCWRGRGLPREPSVPMLFFTVTVERQILVMAADIVIAKKWRVGFTVRDKVRERH